jgi:hypothetical protein
LCLCLYADAQLLNGLGCLIYRSNPVNFTITGLGAIDYYAVAVDLHLNERLDADEPFEIYNKAPRRPPTPSAGRRRTCTSISSSATRTYRTRRRRLTETGLTSPTPTETELAAPTPSATRPSPGRPQPRRRRHRR